MIYNRIKKGPPLTMNLGINSNSNKKEDPENPHLIKEEEFLEEEAKPLETVNKIFRPIPKGSRLNAKAIWNPRGQVDPTSL